MKEKTLKMSGACRTWFTALFIIIIIRIIIMHLWEKRNILISLWEYPLYFFIEGSVTHHVVSSRPNGSDWSDWPRWHPIPFSAPIFLLSFSFQRKKLFPFDDKINSLHNIYKYIYIVDSLVIFFLNTYSFPSRDHSPISLREIESTSSGPDVSVLYSSSSIFFQIRPFFTRDCG